MSQTYAQRTHGRTSSVASKTRPPTSQQRDSEHASSAGMPLFLTNVRYSARPSATLDDPFEQEAERAGEDAALAGRTKGGGAPWQTGAPAGVRIHDDASAHATAAAYGANAFARGRDIYFAQGKYAPGTPEGDRVLAHEIAHVEQHTGPAAGRTQFDLTGPIRTLSGEFQMNMRTFSGGMSGSIEFMPEPYGPYSAEINLIQALAATDRRPASAGWPIDWSRVGSGAQAHRNRMMTPGGPGVPRGWHIDQDVQPGQLNDPSQTSVSSRTNYPGWLRSPTELHEAAMHDSVWFPVDVDFDFETVAKGTDTQTIFGVLNWGFKVRGGKVTGEYAFATDAGSAAFDEALERFRGIYSHETLVIYFDTNKDEPSAGEEGKLDEAASYLSRYKDTRLLIVGFADQRGTEKENYDLGLARAKFVESLLLSKGADASQLDPMSWGETEVFAPGAQAGQQQANRRVTLTFFRSATTGIVMP